MKLISLEELAKYEDQYIALSQNRVQIVASGKTVNELEKKLKKMKVTSINIEYISPINASISPLCQ